MKNQKQSVRINNSCGNKRETIYSVPEGSVLEPLLFNIDLIGFFFKCEDENGNSYADEDDNTPYSCAEEMSSVIFEIQRIVKKNSCGLKTTI